MKALPMKLAKISLFALALALPGAVLADVVEMPAPSEAEAVDAVPTLADLGQGAAPSLEELGADAAKTEDMAVDEEPVMRILPFPAPMPVEAPQADRVVPAESEPENITLLFDPDEEGFAPFKCPIEKIRSAYQNLVDPEDTLVALAIEKQTLAICRQSQEALIKIAENETRLVELFEPIIAPSAPEVIVPVAPVNAPAPVREGAGLGSEVATLADLEALKALEEALNAEPAPEPEPAQPELPPFTPPDLMVAAIMKDPMGWKAMLVDDSAIYTVRPGDVLDDGSRIVSIDRDLIELVSEGGVEFTLE